MIFSEPRSPFFGIMLLAPFDNANPLGARQYNRAGKADEQPMLDDARDRVQQACQTRRIGDPSKMGIDNPVATIGDKNVAVLPLADPHLPGNAGLRQCPRDGEPGSPEAARATLDGQRNTSD